jgi:hypothetical protein
VQRASVMVWWSTDRWRPTSFAVPPISKMVRSEVRQLIPGRVSLLQFHEAGYRGRAAAAIRLRDNKFVPSRHNRHLRELAQYSSRYSN